MIKSYNKEVKYKMVVFDIDGTLLPYSTNKISKNIVTLFKELKNNGFIVVIATGRDNISIGEVCSSLNPDYFIGSNGGFIKDWKKQEVIKYNSISIESWNKLYSKIIKAKLDIIDNIILSDKKYIYIKNQNKLYQHWFWKDYIDKFLPIDEYKKSIDSESFSLITINVVSEELTKKAKKYLDNELPDLHVQASWKNGFFISNRGVNKYKSIIELADRLNVKNEEIIAFGDGENDIEMIKNVGFGVAMGNGIPKIKKIAQDIAPDVNDFGVISYLKNKGLI